MLFHVVNKLSIQKYTLWFTYLSIHMQRSHIQIKIKLFKPPWEEDLDNFFFPSKAICTSLKIEKHRSLEEGGHILLQGVYQNEQGEAGI